MAGVSFWTLAFGSEVLACLGSDVIWADGSDVIDAALGTGAGSGSAKTVNFWGRWVSGLFCMETLWEVLEFEK